MKIAALFSGQGAQFVGMGKDLYENFPFAKECFDNADDILKTPIKSVCFDGPEEKLKMTENTQPAVMLLSYICYKLLENEGIKAEAFAGFSLGEYSALTGAEVIKFEDGLKIVRERGVIMDRATSSIKGGMAAIIGLEDAKVEEACRKVTDGIVVAANYNCPGQLVISGEEGAVEKAAKFCEEAGATKVVILKVSGPFHSPLYEKAGAELEKTLGQYEFAGLNGRKIASNVTAGYHKDGEIKPMLVKQMYSPVRWRKTIENLIANGFDTFIEVGPGRTLTGFMRTIDRSKAAFNIGCVNSFKKTLEALKK
jgi:[acyl-carrier-protein] S-malonyltransferase